MAHRIYQLKVSLQGTAPGIWRRILVSANLTLRQASGVLRQAMGWSGTLPYCYRLDGREFGRYGSESEYLEDDTMFTLRSCLCAPGDTLEYAYGRWRHTVELGVGRFRAIPAAKWRH